MSSSLLSISSPQHIQNSRELMLFIVVRYIAVEFASIWRGMGANVNLYFRKELPLRL